MTTSTTWKFICMTKRKHTVVCPFKFYSATATEVRILRGTVSQKPIDVDILTEVMTLRSLMSGHS